jgi:CRP/FNR family transcriptional regulator, anaerobic regulatory protein
MEELLQSLLSIAPMSQPLLAHLRARIKRIEYEKKELILREGKIANMIFFIQSGLVRSYYLLGGEEITNWFMKEGDICISVLSFLRRTPSVDILVAEEPCVCFGITHEELEETYKLFPEFNIHGRIITGEYYCLSEDRSIALKRLTPADRYALMMEKDPDLISRVSIQNMASFLNVKTRTYQKIRLDFTETNRKRPRQ